MNMHVCFLLVSFVGVIYGHGFMKVPPARNCMWRYGFPNPPNYSDNENFCGGSSYMNEQGGKCGVCGDPYGKAQPHADGGKYANNLIGRTYKQGQVIDIEIQLSASHFGYFEFRINNFDNKVLTGDNTGKLNGYLMELTNGGTQFIVKRTGWQIITLKLKLPANLYCERCVIQWWYRGGNSWGCDDQNRCGLGYGPQEHFVNCADVKITK